MNFFNKTIQKNIAFAATIFLGLNLSACGGGSDKAGGGASSSSQFDGLVFLADANIDGVTELFRTGKDSSSVTKLAEPKIINGDIHIFRISPDRKYVAFRGDLDTDEVFELYVVNLLDGAAPVKLSGSLAVGGNVSLFGFRWSPDSSRVAYLADQDTDNVVELYSVFVDGTGNSKVSATQVTGGNVLSYSWSRDSSRLAYLADQDTDTVNELYSVLANGSDNTKVSGTLATGGAVKTFGNKWWSSDSLRIVYLADQDTDEIFELYSVFADGSGNTKVSGTLVTSGDVLSRFLWSPDGSRLAYKADQDTDEVIELYTVFADGSGNTKVSGTMVTGGSVSTATDLRWSPDSSRIVYKADQDTDGVTEIYSVLADGSGNIKVSGSLVAGGEVDEDEILWSPDSSRIAYLADQDTVDIFELYSALADGTNNVIKVSGSLVTGGEVISFLW